VRLLHEEGIIFEHLGSHLFQLLICLVEFVLVIRWCVVSLVTKHSIFCAQINQFFIVFH